MIGSLDLQVRYFQDSPEVGFPYREEHFIRRETTMVLPIAQTALVLVDTWDNHFILSWLGRAEQTMRDAVVPALNGARSAGLTVIHAPSPRVTPSYRSIWRVTCRWERAKLRTGPLPISAPDRESMRPSVAPALNRRASPML